MFENYCNAFFCRAVFATHCSDFRVNIVILADFRFFSPLPCTNNERTTSNEFLALNKCLLALWHRAPCEHTTNMNTEIHEKQVTTEQLIQFNCSCLIPQVFFLLGKSTAISAVGGLPMQLLFGLSLKSNIHIKYRKTLKSNENLLKVTRIKLFINKANEFRSGRFGRFCVCVCMPFCSNIYMCVCFGRCRRRFWARQLELVAKVKSNICFHDFKRMNGHCSHSYSTKNMQIWRSFQQL